MVTINSAVTIKSSVTINAAKTYAAAIKKRVNSLLSAHILLKSLFITVLSLQSLNVQAQQQKADIEYYDEDNITNQIPYFDNRFRIDEQLEEVTLIFYRRRGSKPVILVRPDGSKIRVNHNLEGKVQWFDDSTFDMVKIKSPMIGPWQVIGAVQPNSKIMVVSEIRLEVTPLPELILQDETLKVEGRIYNGERPIDNPSFNDVIELNVDFYSTNNSSYDNFGSEPVKLSSFRDDGYDLDERARDSVFTGEFELYFSPGEWEPIYSVKMPLATRKLRQTPIIVHKNPISISVETTQDVDGSHRVTFDIDKSFVDPQSILLQGKVTFPDKQQKPFSVLEAKGEFRNHDIPFTEPGMYRIKVDVFGETIKGREFRATLPEFSFKVENLADIDSSALSDNPNRLTPEQKAAQAKANAAIEAEKLAQAKLAQEAEIAAQQQQTLWYIIAGNLIVIILAALIFILMRRKKNK